MPTPTQHSKARDLFEAAQAFIEARGRRCGVCTGHSPSWDGHDANPPCETFAYESLRQHLAAETPTPGESEGAAKWRITRGLFDDVARSAEVEAGEPMARFYDLDDDLQRTIVSGLGGVFGQFAQVARSRAPQ